MDLAETLAANRKRPQTLLLFRTSEDARDHRRQHGTGGWIFSNDEMTILFPPELTPSDIFNHPVTKGHGGKLIGSQ